MPRDTTSRGGPNAGSDVLPPVSPVRRAFRPPIGMTRAASVAGLDTEAAMSLIHLRNVGVISPRVLFTNLDLTLHETDRIGLIAGNGMGKTTLLRCLAGQAEPGIGDIICRRGLRIGF